MTTICINKGGLIGYKKLNTFGYFLFFWLLGWRTWVQNPWIFQMPQILKSRCNFTLRWLPDLGNTYLEQNLRLKTLDYLLFNPAVLFLFLSFYLLFGCPMVNFWLLPSKQSHSPNVNHCIWVFSFWPRVGLGGAGSLHLTECPVQWALITMP